MTALSGRPFVPVNETVSSVAVSLKRHMCRTCAIMPQQCFLSTFSTPTLPPVGPSLPALNHGHSVTTPQPSGCEAELALGMQVNEAQHTSTLLVHHRE